MGFRRNPLMLNVKDVMIGLYSATLVCRARAGKGVVVLARLSLFWRNSIHIPRRLRDAILAIPPHVIIYFIASVSIRSYLYNFQRGAF